MARSKVINWRGRWGWETSVLPQFSREWQVQHFSPKSCQIELLGGNHVYLCQMSRSFLSRVRNPRFKSTPTLRRCMGLGRTPQSMCKMEIKCYSSFYILAFKEDQIKCHLWKFLTYMSILHRCEYLWGRRTRWIVPNQPPPPVGPSGLALDTGQKMGSSSARLLLRVALSGFSMLAHNPRARVRTKWYKLQDRHIRASC